MKYILTILLLLHFSLILSAQDSLRVSVLGNVKEDTIQLRWAVNSPMAWKLTNQYGFRVERYTVVRNDEVLSQPEKVILKEVVKAKQLNDWENLATQNQYAAIIAQALYGEQFQLSGDDAKGVSKFLALAQELEQRYLVSMYAADLCFPGAVMAGWGLEDTSVQYNERYLYRVVPLVPKEKLVVEMGSYYISLKEAQPLPEPQELTAVFGDKSVMLTWNYGILKSIYNAYYLEKSLDGKSFIRVSDIPLMNMNAKAGEPLQRMYYLDTLAANAVKTFYRLVGINAFNQEGPPSKIVSGEGKNKLIYVPHIRRAIPNSNGGVLVEWEFDERGNADVKHFELLHANNHNGPYLPVLKEIASSKREATYDTLHASNYFIISAIPNNGEAVSSFPVLVQPIDSIPPGIPKGLTGVVDTLGMVKLSWTANTERDLLGYRIYRAQTKGEELIPLTDVAIRKNEFIDTLDVYNLNSQVYYAVTALDMRYNQSKQSQVAELQKPEVIPPSPPLITKYKVIENGVTLQWATGMEENLQTILLYRQDLDSIENRLIKTINDIRISSYTDQTVLDDRGYKYSVICVSKGGLHSDPSPIVTVQSGKHGQAKNELTQFIARKNKKQKSIELYWDHSLSDIKQFEIYKAVEGKNVSLWKVLKGFENKIDDKDVESGLSYQYMIRPIFDNGANGKAVRVEVKY